MVSDDEILAEVARRGLLGRCGTCRRRKLYLGRWDSDGHTLRCSGCRRTPARCTCR